MRAQAGRVHRYLSCLLQFSPCIILLFLVADESYFCSERLKDSQNTAAMLTTYNEIDMTSIIEARNLYKDEL